MLYVNKSTLHDIILVTNITTSYYYYVLSLRDSRGYVINYNCEMKGSNNRYTKIELKLADIQATQRGEYAYKIVMANNATDTSIEGKEVLETGIIKFI
jgi:hypothetical protein